MFLQPLAVEGQLEYRALLFFPKWKRLAYFAKKQKRNNIKLYVRRLLHVDSQDLLPNYLNFVMGVVDIVENVEDLLPHGKIIEAIREKLVERVMEMLEKLAEDNDKYAAFYKQFSKTLKVGLCGLLTWQMLRVLPCSEVAI